MRKFAAAALIAGSAIVSTPARAEEVYITGFGHIFSLGVCSIGPGRCVSYLGIEGTIIDMCENRPNSPVKIVGHSMGASAAIRAANWLTACRVKVDSVVFLDPQTHPRAFGLPKGTRTVTLYSSGFSGAGERKAPYINPENEGVMLAFDPAARLGRYDDAESYAGGHIMQAFDGRVLARARAFLDGKGG